MNVSTVLSGKVVVAGHLRETVVVGGSHVTGRESAVPEGVVFVVGLPLPTSPDSKSPPLLFQLNWGDVA
eukprot:3674411-Rhodomonas_salina.1